MFFAGTRKRKVPRINFCVFHNSLCQFEVGTFSLPNAFPLELTGNKK